MNITKLPFLTKIGTAIKGATVIQKVGMAVATIAVAGGTAAGIVAANTPTTTVAPQTAAAISQPAKTDEIKSDDKKAEDTKAEETKTDETPLQMKQNHLTTPSLLMTPTRLLRSQVAQLNVTGSTTTQRLRRSQLSPMT